MNHERAEQQKEASRAYIFKNKTYHGTRIHTEGSEQTHLIFHNRILSDRFLLFARVMTIHPQIMLTTGSAATPLSLPPTLPPASNFALPPLSCLGL